MFRKYLLPLFGAAMLVFAIYHAVRANQTPRHAEPLTEPARSPFRTAIAGTGLVEPQTENIAIGSHHSGVVDQVMVKVGDPVRKGVTPLFRLDDRMHRAELSTRQANLKAAQAQLERLRSMPRPEEIPPAEARLREAQANLADQEDHYNRTAKLGSDAISGVELVKRKQTMEMAREQVRRAEADLSLLKAGAWDADLLVAEAAVAQAQALLQQTKTELERLEVRASVDGEVLQVNVRPGEFVGTQSGQALLVIGSVAKHIRVDIDENDLARFRPGLMATARRRGDSTVAIPLTFVRVEPYVVPKRSLAGGTKERVDTRVLQVIYAVNSSDSPLFVGQQVDVFLNAD